MRRRFAAVPAAAWMCALFALLHGVTWAVVQPPLQGPDEQVHIAYVEYVDRTGELPTSAPSPGDAPGPGKPVTQPLPLPLESLFFRSGWSTEGPPVWSPGQERAFVDILQRTAFDAGSGDSYVRNNPPLYYGLELAAVKLTGVQDVRDRALVMRLGSSLIAAFTAFFIVLFIRELLPRRPWIWAVGGLAVVANPLFGFLAGSVNPDNLVAACGAAMLWLVARGFRCGLSPGLAVCIGAAALAGMLSKTSMAGILPGVAVACLIMAARQRATVGGGRRAAAALGAGAGVFAGGFAAWLALNQTVFGRAPSGTASGFTADSIQNLATLGGQLSYTWQFFLYKLPFMNEFPRMRANGLWQTYVQGFIGRFGWFQFGFPLWVNIVGTVVILAVLALAIRALVINRHKLSSRWAEIGSYALMGLGLLALVTVAAYRYKLVAISSFEQTRYLLPLLGLWGAAVALALHGLSERRGRLVGAALGALLIAHALAAQFLALGRYYG